MALVHAPILLVFRFQTTDQLADGWLSLSCGMQPKGSEHTKCCACCLLLPRAALASNVTMRGNSSEFAWCACASQLAAHGIWLEPLCGAVDSTAIRSASAEVG